MQWIAVYNDETSLMQYEDGVENKYKDIDRSKITHFLLVDDSSPTNPQVKLQLHLDSTKKLIYRQRVFKTMSSGPEQPVDENGNFITEDHIIYLVGYQEKDSRPVIMYYYPELGKVELDNERNNIELVPEEVRDINN